MNISFSSIARDFQQDLGLDYDWANIWNRFVLYHFSKSTVFTGHFHTAKCNTKCFTEVAFLGQMEIGPSATLQG